MLSALPLATGLFACWLAPLLQDPVAPPAAALPDETRPTLEEIFRPPRLLGRRARDVAVSADGRWVTYRWSEQDNLEPQDDHWLASTSDGSARILFPHAEKAAVRWTGRGASLLVTRQGRLERLDVEAGTPAVPLFEGADLARLSLLDDGRRAVLSTGDERQLWVLDLDTGRRHAPAAHLEERSEWFAVLEDAERLALFARPPAEDAPAAGPDVPPNPSVLWLVPLDENGKPQATTVPVGGRVSVSADALWAAASRIEPSVERSLVMADYLGPEVRTVPVRSSLAGDPPGQVSLVLYDLQEGTRFDAPLDASERYFLQRAEWSPNGHRLLVERISADWKVRQVLVVDPQARAAWPVAAERDEAWIGGPHVWAGWSQDGTQVLYTSEQTGFNHLHRVPAEGGPGTPLTAGDFEVQDCQPIPDSGRVLLQVSSPHDPAARQIELLDVERGLSLRLTSEEGCAEGVRGGWSGGGPFALSRDGSVVVYQWETLGVPGELYALALREPDGNAGDANQLAVRSLPVRLTHTVPEELVALHLTPPQIVEYGNPDDGTTVRSFLHRPEPFDPDARYPAVVFVHGAGYLQNVTRSATAYEVDLLFHQRLARRGYVVLAPDFRHSAGYGRDFRAAVHGHLGGKDLDDVVAGVEYLRSLGFVDVERVGLYGGSYGGFLTLMALFTRPEVFACGAALRSVTDWRTYSAGYSNPRLGTPQDDGENYRRSSPIDHVEGLARPLLLLHGLQDDNVFAQDSIRLMERLIALGKDFEAMLYPSQGHGFTDPASWIDEYRRIERFFDRHLR